MLELGKQSGVVFDGWVLVTCEVEVQGEAKFVGTDVKRNAWLRGRVNLGCRRRRSGCRGRFVFGWNRKGFDIKMRSWVFNRLSSEWFRILDQ